MLAKPRWAPLIISAGVMPMGFLAPIQELRSSSVITDREPAQPLNLATRNYFLKYSFNLAPIREAFTRKNQK